jgi:tRNA(fMet)-specific endonuclease VapC
VLRYLLDIDFCMEVVRKRPPALRDRFNAEAGRLAVSAVTLAEPAVGVEKSKAPSRNREVIERFAARLQVLVFDAKAAWHYGEIRADLERRGCPIGAYDLRIAAHARAESLILVTGNAREFAGVPALQFEDWRAGR